jgi:GT2 family glycosyltransferase
VSGDIVGIINADDYYEKDAIRSSVSLLQKQDADYTIAKVKKFPSNVVVSPIFPLDKTIYQGMMYPHIGAFIKTFIYKKVGTFDVQYKVAADFDLALKIHKQGYKVAYVDKVIAYIQEGGVSDDDRTKKENMQIAIAQGRNVSVAKMYYLKYLMNSILQELLPENTVKILRQLKKSRSEHAQ